MGDTCSTIKESEFNKKYYFEQNEVDNELGPNFLNNAEMEKSVALNIEIKNVDKKSEHRVELINKSENRNKLSTEKKSKNDIDNTIIFQQFFSIPYYFERQQLLEFIVYFNDNEYESIQTSLGTIMGSRGQTLKKKLLNGEDIYIKGKELKKSSKEIIFDIIIQGMNLTGMKFRYFITNLGIEQKPENIKLYDSEVKGINKNSYEKNKITFMNCKIPIMYLNPGGDNTDSSISIEIFDILHKRGMGNYQGAYSILKNTNHFEIVLTNNIRAYFNCKVENHPTFISYLRSGINIGLTIGIDFTGSNGHYKDPPSLHYLGEGLNNYESAIRSCGDIVSAYDKEQSFPVFAFGFNFIDPHLNNFDGRYTDFNYPINCTMINDLIMEVDKELEEGQTWNYHIIMILTDGMIDDMQETKDSLVAASFLPISVIIIGIGNGDFTKMNVLDADEYPLYDRSGRKADRDLVQFVPYNNFKNNPQKLAEQVLEEIPRQVVEYYQHKGIQPND